MPTKFTKLRLYRADGWYHKKLMKNKLAYKSADDGIYFDISKIQKLWETFTSCFRKSKRKCVRENQNG